MGCTLSEEKIKINNILKKNHEIASTFGEITLRKDEYFDILCFETNCDEFLLTRICLWPINPLCAPPPTSVYYSHNDGRYNYQ